MINLIDLLNYLKINIIYAKANAIAPLSPEKNIKC